MSNFKSICKVITEVYDQVKSDVSSIDLPEVRELYNLSNNFINDYISNSPAYRECSYHIEAGALSMHGHFKSESMLDLVQHHFRDCIHDITITHDEGNIFVEYKKSAIDSIRRNLHYKIAENTDLKELSSAWIDELKSALVNNNLDTPELVNSPFVQLCYDDNNIGKLQVVYVVLKLETLEAVRTRISDRSELSFFINDKGFKVESFIRDHNEKLIILDGNNSTPDFDLQSLDDLKIYSITDLINYLALHGNPWR